MTAAWQQPQQQQQPRAVFGTRVWSWPGEQSAKKDFKLEPVTQLCGTKETCKYLKTIHIETNREVVTRHMPEKHKVEYAH